MDNEADVFYLELPKVVSELCSDTVFSFFIFLKNTPGEVWKSKCSPL